MTAFRTQAQTNFLTYSRNRAFRNQAAFHAQATPAIAQNMVNYAELYPNNTAELGLALASAGVPASDPMVAEVAMTELANRQTLGPIDEAGGGWFDMLARGVDEFIIDPIKGTVRWGMMGMMAPYEMTAGGAPIRVAGGGEWAEQQPFLTQSIGDIMSDPGGTISSLWKEATTADEQQAEMLRSGELQYSSNQGGGWFAQSELDPTVQGSVNEQMAQLESELNQLDISENERYKRMLEAAPDMWDTASQTALQEGLGAPMTQQGYANRESILFAVPNFTTGDKFYTPYSPGRFAAATVFEPGTTAFATASGIADFASQIVLDPLNFAGAAWAKAGIRGATVAGKQAKFTKTMNQIRSGAINAPYSDVATGVAHAGGPTANWGAGAAKLSMPGLEDVGKFATDTPLTTKLGQPAIVPNVAEEAIPVVDQADEAMNVIGNVVPGYDFMMPFQDESAAMIDNLKMQVGSDTMTGRRPMPRTTETVVEYRGRPLTEYEYQKQLEHNVKMRDHYLANPTDEVPASGSGRFSRGRIPSSTESAAEHQGFIDEMNEARKTGRAVSGPGSEPIPTAPASAVDVSGISRADWEKIDAEDWIEVYHVTDTADAQRFLDNGITGKDKKVRVGDDIRMEKGETGEGLYVGRDPEAIQFYVHDPSGDGISTTLKIKVRKKDILKPREAHGNIDEFATLANPRGGATVFGDIPPGNITAVGRSGGMDIPVSARNLVDEAQAALPTGKQAGLPAPADVAIGMGAGEVPARAKPWWLSPEESAKRMPGATDPPEWAIESYRRAHQGILDTEVMTSRVGPGHYVIGGPEGGAQNYTLKKIGEKWAIFDSAGNPVDGIGGGYRTLTEAEAQAKKLMGFEARDPMLGGESMDSFADNYDDLWMDEGGSIPFFASATNPASRTDGDLRHLMGNKPRMNTRTAKPGENSNAKVRVFGKTIDTANKGGEIPEAAAAILRKAGKLDKHGYKGFGDELLDKIPEELYEWMRQNGYGKIKIEDKVIVLDDFVGGSSKDPLGRVWFDDGKKPIQDLPVGQKGPTPDDMNEYLDWMYDLSRSAIGAQDPMTGAKMVGDFAGETPDMVKLADMAGYEARWDAPGSAMPGMRSSINMDLFTSELLGKNASTFVDELVSAAEEGPARVDRILDYFSSQGIPIDLATRRRIIGAKDVDSMRGALAHWVASGPGKIEVPHFGMATRYGKMSGTGLVSKVTSQPGIARRFSSMLPTEGVNLIDDPGRAYETLNRILPNYNVIRGSDEAAEGIEYIVKGKVVTTRKIEDIMDDMRHLEPGNRTEAYKVMGDYAEYIFAKAMDSSGGDADLAKAATRFWNEIDSMHSYDVGRTGITGLATGQGDSAAIFSNEIFWPGPQYTSQAWSGAVSFPDPKVAKRVMNNSDIIGRTANFLSSKTITTEAGQQLVDRTGYLWATGVMNNVWKPLVLLRGAWTFRIMLDDQMRVAAEGMDSVFSNPMGLIGYALSRSDDWRSAFSKGFVDVHGVKFDLKDIDSLAHGHFYKSAMMELPDASVGPMAFGHRQWVDVEKGQTGYNDGLSTAVAQMAAEPQMSRLAASTSDNRVDDAVKWLQGSGGPPGSVQSDLGVKQRLALAELYKKDPELSAKIADGDPYTLKKLMEQQDGNLHHATGGFVLEDDGYGNWRYFEDRSQIYNNPDVIANPKPRAKMADGTVESTLVVHQKGDADLIAIVADGKGSMDVPLMNKKRVRADDPTEVGVPTSAGFDELKTLVGGKVKDSDLFPSKMGTPNSAAIPDSVGPIDKAEQVKNGFFSFFMGKPSDWLSRSPVFKQAYWRSMGERLPFMDDATRAAVMKRARQANVDGDILKIEKSQTKLYGKMYDEVGGQITDLDQLDEYGKAAGLAQVEATLFDLSNKRNISDSLNLIMPFAEAWGEFISRWSRLMVTGDRNVQNVNRLRQGVNGLRQSDPFDVDGNQGFFHENDFGQEVFSYPAFLTKGTMAVHNVMNNLPVMNKMLGPDVDPSYADQLDVTASVESLNFAAGVIPGFGPVFQTAAKAVLPEDPSWDWVRNIVMPFGTSGGAGTALLPAWAKRVASAHGSDDPALQSTYTSTVQDVMRTMMNDGEFAGFTTGEEFNAKAAEAEERAKALLMVRAASTFWMPSSPSYTFQKEDKNGLLWSYSQLGSAYRDILYGEAQSDDGKAFDLFVQRYGFLPTAFTDPRSYVIEPHSLTAEGGVFERNNMELFDRYPGTAMFIDPNVGSLDTEYDHSLYIGQLARSEREQWTAEQMTFLADDQLGDIWWDNANKLVVDMEPAMRDAALAQTRIEIQAVHPLWNQPIPGKSQGITNEQQMAEVNRWMEDPSVRGTPIAQATAEYLNLRNQILAANAKYLGSTTISGSEKEIASYGRKALRDLASQLERLYPEFGPLWRNVYASEVSMDHDGYDKAEFELYGDNIFAETLGV